MARLLSCVRRRMRKSWHSYREMKMQQTKSYWRVLAVAGVVGAFVASACVVTSSTDDSSGDDTGAAAAAGATGTAGASTSGAGSSSMVGTAGTGTVLGAYECDPADGGSLPSTPAASCVAAGVAADCASCLQTSCCTEVSACYATNPGNECGFGGPPSSGGEFLCVETCLRDGFADSGVDDSDLRQGCFDKCTTSTANGASQDCPGIGTQTNALIGCVSDNCLTECIGG
jgi:hypothetical protein